jgi:hypothetical protein
MRLKDGDKMTVEGMEAKIAKRTEAFRSEYGYGQWLDATRGGMSDEYLTKKQSKALAQKIGLGIAYIWDNIEEGKHFHQLDIMDEDGLQHTRRWNSKEPGPDPKGYLGAMRRILYAIDHKTHESELGWAEMERRHFERK